MTLRCGKPKNKSRDTKEQWATGRGGGGREGVLPGLRKRLLNQGRDGGGGETERERKGWGGSSLKPIVQGGSRNT